MADCCNLSIVEVGPAGKHMTQMQTFRLSITLRRNRDFRWKDRSWRHFRLYMDDAGHKAFVSWEALERSLGVRKYQITRAFCKSACGVYDVTQQVISGAINCGHHQK